MASSGYFSGLNLELREDLLYKGVSFVWMLTSKPEKYLNDPVSDIFDQIMDEDVGVQDPDLSRFRENLFERLKSHLEHILSQKKIVEEKFSKVADKVNASGESGRMIGSRIIFCLHPLISCQLIGGKANQKKIFLAFQKAFKFGKLDVISLEFFMNGIAVKNIIWLKDFQHLDSFRKCITAKLVKWLWRITKKFVASKFYVTETQSKYHKLVFIPKKTWKSRTDMTFNSYVRLGIFQRLTEPEAQKVIKLRSPAWLRWIPKEDGLRPIVSVRNDRLQKDTILAKVFVRHLVQKRCTSLNALILNRIWARVIERYHSYKWTHLFLVAVDLHDAYGSIIQDKLVEIVKEESVSCLGNITAETFVHFDHIFVNNKETIICRELYEGTPFLPRESNSVSVSYLIEIIRRRVKYQTIQRKKNLYWIKKGISQAVALSASLCTLYLSHMDRMHLAKEFTSNEDNTLLRIMDDYLYITPHKAQAESFLKKMSSGFIDYGLEINEKKTQTNLYSSYEISYFGYLINPITLEMYVKYIDGASVPFRNSMVFSNNLTPIQTLQDKMKRIPTYKLNILTTDRRYMSAAGVTRNIFETSCMMACSFKAIVNSWFRPASDMTLLNIIKGSAQSVAKKIQKLRAPKDITYREAYWIVLRAFLLCFSHGAHHDNSSFSALPFVVSLQELEEAARNKVHHTFLKQVQGIVRFLPKHFQNGY